MKAGSTRNRAVQLAWVFASVLAALGLAQCQDQVAGWQQQVRDQVAAHHLDVALVLVDERLSQNGADLEARFDALCTQGTGFPSIDGVLKGMHARRASLLRVLDRPDVPLHNNLSEGHLRDYV